MRALADRYRIVLICDDIQVGCGRTGTFFSFERAGIVPDMVILSKSISGYGLPMSIVLVRPELDVWEPGQHTGTFRGNQIAFVAAAAALDYADKYDLFNRVRTLGVVLGDHLEESLGCFGYPIDVRGIGMIWGVDLADCGGPGFARDVARRCFEHGLIIERVGRNDTVLKVMPPLTIDEDLLLRGCSIIRQSIQECLGQPEHRVKSS